MSRSWKAAAIAILESVAGSCLASARHFPLDRGNPCIALERDLLFVLRHRLLCHRHNTVTSATELPPLVVKIRRCKYQRASGSDQSPEHLKTIAEYRANKVDVQLRGAGSPVKVAKTPHKSNGQIEHSRHDSSIHGVGAQSTAVMRLHRIDVHAYDLWC